MAGARTRWGSASASRVSIKRQRPMCVAAPAGLPQAVALAAGPTGLCGWLLLRIDLEHTRPRKWWDSQTLRNASSTTVPHHTFDSCPGHGSVVRFNPCPIPWLRHSRETIWYIHQFHMWHGGHDGVLEVDSDVNARTIQHASPGSFRRTIDVDALNILLCPDRDFNLQQFTSVCCFKRWTSKNVSSRSSAFEILTAASDTS